MAGFSTGIPVSVAASVAGPDIAAASLVNPQPGQRSFRRAREDWGVRTIVISDLQIICTELCIYYGG